MAVQRLTHIIIKIPAVTFQKLPKRQISKLIYAFDTYYKKNQAKTVCLSFKEWADQVETNVLVEEIKVSSDYTSGAFFKRELPCILSLLSKIQLQFGDIIIIDGYVTLDDKGKLGLGGILYNELGNKFPVVGIAKNKFASTDQNRRLVYRGSSKNPLYVTATGISTDMVSEYVKNMHGAFRIPALLKKLDQFTRQ